ncbi:hypothetical protein DMB66_56655 [Actinoplanes sp. ATCC 53533]|nr:hypothetical protein DMB66_56655 [Actinoplanes sp. ATCC 53533]
MLALALTSCGDGEQTAAAGSAGQASPSPAITTASAATPPSPTAPVPTTPESTRAAPPCEQNKAWSSNETVKWVTEMVKFDSASNFAFGLYSTAGTVCRAVPVQLEIWKVALANEFGGVRFDMKSIFRKQISLDGRRVITVKTPELPSGTCTGSIIAVYVGKPLRTNELPKTMEIFGGAISADVKFRSTRIAYSVGSMPTPAPGLTPNNGLPGC